MFVSHSSVAAAGDGKLAATAEETACTIYLRGAVALALAAARRLSVIVAMSALAPVKKMRGLTRSHGYRTIGLLQTSSRHLAATPGYSSLRAL